VTGSARSFLKRVRRPLAILGLTALAIGVIAAFAVAVKFSADLQLGGSQDRAEESDADAPGPAPQFPASDYQAGRSASRPGKPLIGVNYTHHGFRDCSFEGTAILRTYSRPGVAAKVHRQLLRMRRAGVTTIRTIVWHMTDATRETWGPISSAGGRPGEPYRTNLIRFVREIRRFGFKRLTVSFGPQKTQNALLVTYDPGTFEENWGFVRSIRALVKRHGPPQTRFDLLNEGAPSEAPTEWSPAPDQTRRYLSRIYRAYVGRFGNRDVSVSAISWDGANRVGSLIETLRASGRPLPRWYDVHIGYTAAQASYGLRSTDSVLRQSGVRRPLVVGETSYDSDEVARVIQRFLQRSRRPIEEVSPWFVRTMQGCQVPPPYRPGAYARVRSG
jgi:hypothetical protein